MNNPLSFLWWLATPLASLLKFTMLPENVRAHLQLDPNIPVLYVLPRRSLSDLLVLFHFCQKTGLPLPQYKAKALRKGEMAGYIYLTKLGLWQPKKSGAPPPPLQKLCERCASDPVLNVQLVPVSIIWGRNPGREKRSMFQLLFPDDEHAGLLQKVFIILAQGRDSLIHFGKPISLREQVDQGPSPSDTAKKIRRVLRVHFRNQRNMTLGPRQYDRNRVIASLLQSKPIQAAIEAEMRKTKSSRERIEAKARHYLREISASPMHSMIRFFDQLLTFIWNKIYDGIIVTHSERLRELADQYEIVYVPSHRSHLDYLVLPYELYYMGMNTPHTAAGVNLNFWPAGPILRRGGGFFIRRSFGGNRLYTVAFTEYLRFLLTSGHSIAFFPEGGRSRTGRLLNPKTGMLAMIVDSFVRDHSKPLVFVPLYIGYDRVFEVKSYLGELRGRGKKQENFMNLFKAGRILKSKQGKAYVGFGEPLFLNQWLDQRQPSWKNEDVGDSRPPWFSGLVDDIAQELMVRINRTAVVSPVGLVALALLSTPQRALAENELLEFMRILLHILAKSGNCPEVTLPALSVEQLLAQAEKVSKVNRFTYPGSDVVYLNEIDSVILSYYKNNILHLFALPSLIASYFQHNDQIEVKNLVAGCCEIYPFLQSEFFLKWKDDELAPEILRLVDAMVEKDLLRLSADRSTLTRSEVGSHAFSSLKLLGRVLGLVFERYSISAAMLSGFIGKESIKRKDFEAQCQLLAQRISILNGVNDPEFYDKTLFRKYVDMLQKLGYVSDDAKDGNLRIDPRVEGLAQKSTALLSTDISQSIRRITSERTL